MAKVILTCGRVCSGKSTYAKALCERINAVILSDDEIMLALFGGDAGEAHDEYARRVQKYLMEKSLEIVSGGLSVILDWGFWTRAARQRAREFYALHGAQCEFHYIDVPDEIWKDRIKARNGSVSAGEAKAYYVDEGLINKCLRRFEKPEKEEMDVWITAQ